ncbi:MAG: isoprenyl transferase [Coriobacteriales bacterium]|jgi:undecaprenyl diphosphate synthase|nr:isoprenyl transferase [Coriobacteriales bacterium]
MTDKAKDVQETDVCAKAPSSDACSAAPASSVAALTVERLVELFSPVPPDIDLAAIDTTGIPQHIAVIMDGNGRWALKRGKRRVSGHKAGIEGVRSLIRTSDDLGVRFLTIYSFSTENWSRPLQEVQALMALFAKTMAAELEAMHEKGVRVLVIGDMRPLPVRTRETFERAIDRTAENTGMTLVVALNYGSRTEIVRAAQTLAARAAAGWQVPEDLQEFEAVFAGELDTAGIPDPDLLIRTSGECRVSNFLLYQIAYSELYVTPTLWPDFDRFELLRAIIDYQRRERRFGGA